MADKVEYPKLIKTDKGKVRVFSLEEENKLLGVKEEKKEEKKDDKKASPQWGK
jgi:hypothetical protein